MRAYITKSKSGHYTLSIYDGGKCVWRAQKLATKEKARHEYTKFKLIPVASPTAN